MALEASQSQSQTIKNYLTTDRVGFVECLETFGNDLTVVNAARVSFDKESLEFTEADKKLVTYLAKHDHVSPFFHPQIRFRIKMPIFVAREWYRHTIGLARNEVSRRYVDTPPECWVPFPNEIRERDPRVKQGSKSTPVDDSERVHSILSNQTNAALKTYHDLLDNHVAPELARTILPQSMYTEFIETGSLAAYARLCRLRLNPAAQKEIRDYAEAISVCLAAKFPVSWEALQKSF
jgi:thymidylate synthase (FAD)